MPSGRDKSELNILTNCILSDMYKLSQERRVSPTPIWRRLNKQRSDIYCWGAISSCIIMNSTNKIDKLRRFKRLPGLSAMWVDYCQRPTPVNWLWLATASHLVALWSRNCTESNRRDRNIYPSTRLGPTCR